MKIALVVCSFVAVLLLILFAFMAVNVLSYESAMGEVDLRLRNLVKTPLNDRSLQVNVTVTIGSEVRNFSVENTDERLVSVTANFAEPIRIDTSDSSGYRSSLVLRMSELAEKGWLNVYATYNLENQFWIDVRVTWSGLVKHVVKDK